MKHLEIFENFKDINAICEEYGIQNYTINKDGSVDVYGSVHLSNKNLEKLPLNFGRVGGDFYCSHNSLVTLEGCPREVGGDFYCHNNSLVTLEGGPRKVGGDFSCSYNSLITLEGGPRKVGGYFDCWVNPLPREIYDNIRYIKTILKYQDDYSIWTIDGKLNHYRFDQMMEEILEEEL